ncbi:MAG: DUF192 domain-containing protein [Rhodospirillales bacterium]|nr:DUF192 domain-containing protein [Rhodospirillales bacterium]
MAGLFHFLIVAAVLGILAGMPSSGAIAETQGALEQKKTALPSAQTFPLKIVTQDGRTVYFQVEAATTEAERSRGLMFRKEMAGDHGMIFLFSDVRPRAFWMKNTFLPLDILFLDETGKIVSIRQGVPLSEDGIFSGAPAKAAVELNQGTAEMFGLLEGDTVYFSHLSD